MFHSILHPPARIILKIHKSDYIIPFLRTFQWLPIRMKPKVLIKAFTAKGLLSATLPLSPTALPPSNTSAKYILLNSLSSPNIFPPQAFELAVPFVWKVHFLRPPSKFLPVTEVSERPFFQPSEVTVGSLPTRFLKCMMYVFLAMLGLHCCLGFSLGAVCGILTKRASLLAEHRLPQPWLPASGAQAARASLLGGTWDPPGPGIDPVSPACAGRLFITGPPRKPPASSLSEHPVLFSA